MSNNIPRRYYEWRKSLEPAFSQTVMAREFGVRERTIERWCAGTSTPQAGSRQLIEMKIRSAERRLKAKMPR